MISDALKEAESICKTLFRNGFDAHIVNAPLQQRLISLGGEKAVDLACDCHYKLIAKIFPDAQPAPEDEPYVATLVHNGVLYRFYPLSDARSGHPELALLRMTPTLARAIPASERITMRLSGFGLGKASNEDDPYDGFEPMATGEVKLAGLPDNTLHHNYVLGIRAMRFAANFDLPIEENTRLAIIRAVPRILDYVPASDILDEWRRVDAEAMYRFVMHMRDLHLLPGLIPELAALASVKHHRNKRTSEEEDLLTHTINCVRHYPESGFHYDWMGTLAMLFHDVGKPFTAEYLDGEWTFYQHHRVGAAVTRKILRRLHFPAEDIDLICDLVRSHMYYYFMLTDRGIRHFMSLDNYPRLVAMARADMLARDEMPTTFNHNQKYMERANIPEQMLEPLLNGNEIMQLCHIKPGPMVGLIRDALLKAQIAGDVTDMDTAREFVQRYGSQIS